jgi:DNA (cytosine-5)-methyltransferase 1
MNELALFAGAGGGILGGHLLGWRTVVAVERDAYAAQVLAQRQNDRILRPFPIWSDVTSFDGRPWRGIVDVVSGGFPCQDISAAGKGAGIDGERSGLWGHMRRIIRDVQPCIVWVENSPILTSRGLNRVLGDLAAMGFNAEWGVISAENTGAPHERERIWIFAWRDPCDKWEIVANSNGSREPQPTRREPERGVGIEQRCKAVANADSFVGLEGRPGNGAERARGRDADRGGIGQDVGHSTSQGLAQREGEQCNARKEQPTTVGTGGYGSPVSDADSRQHAFCRHDAGMGWQQQLGSQGRPGFGQWPVEPGMGRVADGVAYRVDRIKALGNGQVPRVAAAAWEILKCR